jgi:iron complex transport system permease protein
VLLPTGEVPVSIVIAVLGGPVLIWVVRDRRTAPL